MMIDSRTPLINQAFPILNDSIFIRQFAAPIPFSPDTVFSLYQIKDSSKLIVLVTTDYADPYDQSIELRDCSYQYKFEFSNLIKPFDNHKTIEIRQHDFMEDGFSVREDDTYKSYYLANLKS